MKCRSEFKIFIFGHKYDPPVFVDDAFLENWEFTHFNVHITYWLVFWQPCFGLSVILQPMISQFWAMKESSDA